jgi:ABC-2 type transport system permease protein
VGPLQGRLVEQAYAPLQRAFSDPEAMRALVGRSKAELERAADLDPRMRAELLRFLDEVERFSALPRPAGAAPAMQPVVVELSEVRRATPGLPRSPYAITFTQGMLWGVLACAASFAIGLVAERQQGTLLRLCVAPIRRGHVLAGKALGCFLAIVGVTTALLVIAVAFFEVRPLSWGLLGLAIVGIGLGFTGIMMGLSVLGRTAQSAAGLSWAVLLVMAMLGGGMLPLFMMPELMQQLAKASPVAWALFALEGAIWRGWTLTEMLAPLGALLGVGGLCFVLGARALRVE